MCKKAPDDAVQKTPKRVEQNICQRVLSPVGNTYISLDRQLAQWKDTEKNK